MGSWQRIKDKVDPIKTRKSVPGRNVLLTDYDEVWDRCQVVCRKKD